LQGKGLSCEIRIVHEPDSPLHFELLDIQIPGAAAPVRICIASWSGEADPEQLKRLLNGSSEAGALSLRITHPRRLVESLLARIAREELERHGIPAVRGHFSYSHTSIEGRVIAAAGFAEKSLGIDIESEDALEGREGLVSRILTPSERADLQLLPEDRRALRPLELWCAKESLGKALGTGLQAPLSRFETQRSSEPGVGAVVEFRHFPDWRAAIAHPGGLIVAVCVPKH
jgi:phosphopantetheinyl transferase